MLGLSMKSLRRVARYVALTLGVTVGGVVIGAMVIAPAVSYAKPAIQRVLDRASAVNSTASTAAASASPIANSVDAVAASSRPSVLTTLKARTTQFANQAILSAGRLPKFAWFALAAGVVLFSAGLGFWLRRARSSGRPVAPVVVVANSGKPVALKATGRTPKSVLVLAESGASIADIARRTRMPLDAVAMCLSMGSAGVRQLQPPTA
jgi:hypothetical protein